MKRLLFLCISFMFAVNVMAYNAPQNSNVQSFKNIAEKPENISKNVDLKAMESPPRYPTVTFNNLYDLIEWIQTVDVDNFQDGGFKKGITLLRNRGEVMIPYYTDPEMRPFLIEVISNFDKDGYIVLSFRLRTDTDYIGVYIKEKKNTYVNEEEETEVMSYLESQYGSRYREIGRAHATVEISEEFLFKSNAGNIPEKDTSKERATQVISYVKVLDTRLKNQETIFLLGDYEIEVIAYDKWNYKYIDNLCLDLVPLTWQNPFNDVAESDWFYKDVEYAERNQLMGGTSTTAFSPNAPISRAAFVTSLWRMEGNPERDYNNKFLDVSDDVWYSKAVLWASGRGYVNGVSEELFAPEAAISRQDIAVILKRYLDFIQYKYSVDDEYKIFADEEEISDYAKDAVQTLNKLGILNGKGGRIDPKGNMTRAEAAAILHRMSKIIKP